jgi:hypothetical protein
MVNHGLKILNGKFQEQFINLNLHIILNGMMKSHSILY